MPTEFSITDKKQHHSSEKTGNISGPVRLSTRLSDQQNSCLSSPNIINSSAKTKDRTRRSATTGWIRGFDKYSPSKETTLSPIKAIAATLKSSYDNPYLEMYLWTLSMSEQHFYDNSFLLLSYSKGDEYKMAIILHRGFIGVDMSYFNKLDQITLLGKGAFGSVYSCRDPKTKVKFAMKHIFGSYTTFVRHFESILSYMAERNANIRAMDSPFVTKFRSSLQIKATGDSFLFIEYCIGDLKTFVKWISGPDPRQISKTFYLNKTDTLQKLYAKNEPLIEACFIYIFELLCALDFLASCNIIHQDIKPDNIMLSNSLHLKLGDLGITYRVRTIHRKTNRFLVNVSDLEKEEKINYERSIEGTLDYQDLEIQMMLLEYNNLNILRAVLLNKTLFNTPKMVYNRVILENTFLIDTWAAGIVAVMLLFRGFMFLNPKHMTECIYPNLPKESTSLFIVSVIGQLSVYSKYVHNGLVKAGGENNKELMEFIASIFKPRLTRCKNFTKEKDVYHNSKILKMRYIDMEKVEKLKTFADRHFNKSSIHLRVIPEHVRDFYTTEEPVNPMTFEQLLTEIEEKRSVEPCNAKLVSLEPGVTINFFS